MRTTPASRRAVALAAAFLVGTTALGACGTVEESEEVTARAAMLEVKRGVEIQDEGAFRRHVVDQRLQAEQTRFIQARAEHHRVGDDLDPLFFARAE